VYDKYITQRKIASFLDRKAKEFPEIFEEQSTGSFHTSHARTQLIDIIIR